LMLGRDTGIECFVGDGFPLEQNTS
jgi:hypothetical protein